MSTHNKRKYEEKFGAFTNLYDSVNQTCSANVNILYLNTQPLLV
jgi:hypothetical protein